MPHGLRLCEGRSTNETSLARPEIPADVLRLPAFVLVDSVDGLQSFFSGRAVETTRAVAAARDRWRPSAARLAAPTDHRPSLESDRRPRFWHQSTRSWSTPSSRHNAIARAGDLAARRQQCSAVLEKHSHPRAPLPPRAWRGALLRFAPHRDLTRHPRHTPARHRAGSR